MAAAACAVGARTGLQRAAKRVRSTACMPNRSTAQHSTAQHSTAQHRTAQHSTALAFGVSSSPARILSSAQVAPPGTATNRRSSAPGWNASVPANKQNNQRCLATAERASWKRNVLRWAPCAQAGCAPCMAQDIAAISLRLTQVDRAVGADDGACAAAAAGLGFHIQRLDDCRQGGRQSTRMGAPFNKHIGEWKEVAVLAGSSFAKGSRDCRLLYTVSCCCCRRLSTQRTHVPTHR